MKCDLHRHLGGSISYRTVHELLASQGSQLTLEQVKARMTFSPQEEFGFHRFLQKFRILEEVRWTVDAIEKAVEQVCWDISRESLDYSELKFSVDKYVSSTGLTPQEVIALIHRCVSQYTLKWGNIINLVLSLKYEADQDQQREIARVIEDGEVLDKLAGIDVVGDEAFFDHCFYRPILTDWKKAGKGIQVHAGESQDGENVRKAIEQLGVDRVAHGIKAVDDQYILDLSRERDVCFDIAITSNICTHTVHNVLDHPVKRMLERGCIITIGTDDPAVLQTSLDKEYELLSQICDLSDDTLLDVMQNSVKYAFNEFHIAP